MPYIPHKQRAELATTLQLGLSTGQLNFVLTDLVDQWIGPLPDYERLNGAIGVLECCKQEIYARIVRPYEDSKIISNGDVYMERPT